VVDLELGAFSVSLTVKDILVSKQFYQKLGFNEIGGDISQNWVILRNGDYTLGLFQGMFENNILTFNPGWDKNGEPLESFNDIRSIQMRLKKLGIKIENEIDEDSTGPASFIVKDPDGNPILFDQHV
jgi:catechol 2,3-dioxygenase-like lactoylglutathione lyase family enzyme